MPGEGRLRRMALAPSPRVMNIDVSVMNVEYAALDAGRVRG